jgi:hypothetical protein
LNWFVWFWFGRSSVYIQIKPFVFNSSYPSYASRFIERLANRNKKSMGTKKQKCTHLLSRGPKLHGITGLRVLSRSSIFNLLRDLARDPAPRNSYITTDHREFSSPITLKETTGQTVAEELLGKIAFDYSKKVSLKTMPCMKSSHFKAKQAVTRSNGPQGSWACQSVHSNQLWTIIKRKGHCPWVRWSPPFVLGLSSVLSGVSWAQYLFYVTKQHRTLWRCREVYVSILYSLRGQNHPWKAPTCTFYMGPPPLQLQCNLFFDIFILKI